MPELPDVEIFRRRLDKSVHRKVICGVEVRCSRLLKNRSARSLQAHLRGKRFTTSTRRGKYLFVSTSGEGWLVLHFGMSGDLSYEEANADVPPHACLLVTYRDGVLVYRSQRKLGRIEWTPDRNEFIQRENLGPDALELSPGAFRELLADRRGYLKSALMDQHFIAGIGNVYADEILFQAGLRPRRKVNDLASEAIELLSKKVKEVLKTAIRCDADPASFPSNFLTSHRETGGRCPLCTSRLKTAHVGGRTSYYCPRDQK